MRRSLWLNSPQIAVPAREPGLYLGVEALGDQSCSIVRNDAGPQPSGCAFAHVNIASFGVFCEPRFLGRARTHIMTATRPPGGSVFLVEDEVMIRMMVSDMLGELGYRVVAEDGAINEAIRR